MTALEGKALLDHGNAIARRYARRIGPEVADELRAEAVLRALRSPPPDGHMEPWLERIYRNLLVDRWRRGQFATVELDAVPDLAGPGTPEEDVLRHERRHRVRESLRRLPREARRVLLSKYYGQLDESAAAARFGVAAATVRTRIHRALARMRERLGDLRAWCPSLFGKLCAQVGAVGLAPIMVAALAVVGNNPPIPETTSQVRIETVEPRAVLASPVRDEAPIARSPIRSRARLAKKAPPVAAVPEPDSRPPVVELGPEEKIVSVILQPEGIGVFAEPVRPAGASMVGPPPNFLSQIEKMIEDRY